MKVASPDDAGLAGPAPHRQGHIAGFDHLRAIGALGVVWIHACDTNSAIRAASGWAGFAVPAFAMISAFLLARSVLSRKQQSLYATLVRRLRRLFPPYAFWTVVYVAVRLLKRVIMREGGSPIDPVACVFLGGASYQLYFVAALVFFTVLLVPILHVAARRRYGPLGALLLLALAACLHVWRPALAAWLFAHGEDTWAMAGPFLETGVYMLLGAALTFLARSGRNRRIPARALLVGGVIIGALLLCAFPLGGARAPVTALAVFCAGLVCPSAGGERSAVGALARYSFGIFLVHALFVEGLQLLAALVGYPLGGAGATLVVILIAYSLSAACVAFLYSFRYTRWAVA